MSLPNTNMATHQKKHVVRFDLWIDPIFDARLTQESDIALSVSSLSARDEAAWAALEQAHVYHISPARNELPERWQAHDALLARCPQLLCVSSGGAGHDTVDVEACTRAGVAVVNQIGGNARSVAEHTLGLILAVSRRIAESDRKLRRERGFTRESVMGHEISEKVLGLVGIGHAGRQVASLAHAFGMRVIAFDPLLAPEEIRARGAVPVDFGRLLAESDVVSLHCPRDATTVGMFSADAFGRMKQHAIFISTARGGIHDEIDLAGALRSGHLAGAGLDVWDPEPPALGHPLLAMDNVVATYHTAGVSHEGRRNVARIAAEQIVQLLRGEQPQRLVNPEVWPLFQERYQALIGPAQIQGAAQ